MDQWETASFRLSPVGEAMGSKMRELGPDDFFLRSSDVVSDAAELDGILIRAVDDVAGTVVSIPGLPDRPDVYEELPSIGQRDDSLPVAVADLLLARFQPPNPRPVGVAAEGKT